MQKILRYVTASRPYADSLIDLNDFFEFVFYILDLEAIRPIDFMFMSPLNLPPADSGAEPQRKSVHFPWYITGETDALLLMPAFYK